MYGRYKKRGAGFVRPVQIAGRYTARWSLYNAGTMRGWGCVPTLGVPHGAVDLWATTWARPLGPLLRGPPRPASVASVYPAAAYLDVGGWLVALTALDAERLPFGIQVPVVAR